MQDHTHAFIKLCYIEIEFTSDFITFSFFIAGELFSALVLSTKPHAKIVKVDTSEAMTVNGVHSYIDHHDIPGKKSYGKIIPDSEIIASEKVLEILQYCNIFIVCLWK